MLKIRDIKKKTFFKSWIHLFLKEAISPISIFSLIVFIFPFLSIYKSQGVEGTIEEAHSALISLTPIINPLIIWIPFVALMSFRKANIELKSTGQWGDKRFSFHSPILVSSLHISPSDDGKKINLTFPNTPRDTVVGYKIEYDGGIAKIQIGNVFINGWDWIDRNKQSGSFLYKGKGKEKILVFCPANSDQTTARIYQTYWEIP